MDIWYVIYEYLPTMVLFLGDFFFQCKVNKYCFVWLHDYKIRWGLHFAWEGGGALSGEEWRNVSPSDHVLNAVFSLSIMI